MCGILNGQTGFIILLMQTIIIAEGVGSVKFFHVYNEDSFIGWEKNGMINKNSGFKIQNVFSVPKQRQFHNIAAKGGTLYNLIKDGKFPFYIDRIAGGIIYYPYQYDKALLNTYEELLGDWFLGVQLHESASTRRVDWDKLIKITGEKGPYDLEKLKPLVKSSYAVTPDGVYLDGFIQDPLEFYVNQRYAETYQEYLEEVTDMFRRRMIDTDGHILPCDSYFMLTKIQNEMGMKSFMPEVGSQIGLMRQAVALVRGIANAYGKTWGTYYECWRNVPKKGAVMPCFNNDTSNEWYLTQETHADNFTEYGENGGSSRLLQNRIYYYSLMSGAHYLSEEWGLNCSFSDMHEFTLSSYGKLKKDFIKETEDILDVKATIPFAIVLPKDYACVMLPGCNLTEHKIGIHSNTYMRLPLTAEQKDYIGHIEDVLKLFFAPTEERYGNEGHVLTNSRFGDVVDIIYEDSPAEAFRKYEYLIDATAEGKFIKSNTDDSLKIIASKDLDMLEAKVNSLIPTVMPVYTDKLPFVVSTDGNGVRYISIFNNEGNTRSIEVGDTIDNAADRTVKVTFNKEANPNVWKSWPENTTIEKANSREYYVKVPAAGFVILTY